MLEITQNKTEMDDETRRAAKKQIKSLQKKLAELQQPLRRAGIPVVILFEGYSAAGKGRMIAKLISELDPRGYQVWAFAGPTDEEKRRPLLWPFWQALPPRGEIAVLERSWYSRALAAGAEDGADSIRMFERQICDDGYLVFKFFLNVSREEQKRRLDKLERDSDTAWRVTKRDREQNENYDRAAERFEALLTETAADCAPWRVIWNDDRDGGTLEVLQAVYEALREALGGRARPEPETPRREWPLLEMPRLRDVDLSPKVTKADYDAAMDREKKRLSELHSRLYREQVPVVLGFEGWDAAGKGGAIRRLSWALDPRGFDVVPIASPTPEALARHYLWRFWKEIPKDGHIVLFDRTWYGRVLVERVEELTPPERWRAAYDEINEFERELCRHGAVVMKFWLQIDQETQLRRFHARQDDPAKRWKITEEDWRNREKWPAYEAAVDEMLQKTSTEYAPWIIVEGNDKRYARLKVMRTVRKALEKRLEK